MTNSIEQFKVGDEVQLERIITIDDVDKFAKLTGDNNPLHMDEKFASQTSLGSRVVHGMLSASFISTVIGEQLPGKGSLWYEQKLNFHSPVRTGEKIRVVVRIIQISSVQKIFVLSTDVYGKDNRQVISGEAKVKMVEQQIKSHLNADDNTNKPVIILGGSGAIGSAAALELARMNYPIFITYLNNETHAMSIVDLIIKMGGMAEAYKLELTQEDEIEKIIHRMGSRYGNIYGFVHAAAPKIINEKMSILQWESIQSHFNVQVKACLKAIQTCIPYMKQNEQSSIVTLSSTLLDSQAVPNWSAYHIAKSALRSLTTNFAVELGPDNIRVNTVAPGMTVSPLLENVPERSKMIERAKTPLGRLANPIDVAKVIRFLISNESSHITGEVLRVCGGVVMNS